MRKKIDLFVMIGIGILILFMNGFAPLERATDQLAGDSLAGRPWDHGAWEKLSYGIAESEVTCVAVSAQAPYVIYAGTPRAVYQSKDGGKSFSPFLYIGGFGDAANDIYVDPGSEVRVYVATDGGLQITPDGGKTWQKIFSTNGASGKRCFSVVADERRVYLATGEGLYYKDFTASTWQRMTQELGSRPVYVLAQDRDSIFAATDNEVFYVNKSDMKAEQIFSFLAREENGDSFAREDDEEDADSSSGDVLKRDIRSMDVALTPSTILAIATSRGIFLSRDRGASWERVSNEGLPIEEVTAISILGADRLFAAGSKGVFCYQDGRWTPVYKGLETQKIHALARDDRGGILAATDKGLYVWGRSPTGPSIVMVDYEGLKKKLESEPTILEVHKMAVEYAEVSPRKITDWRRAAAKRAWMPDVSVGLAGDKNKTLADSVYGTYSSGGQAYVGPNDKTFYDNLGWDVSLSWDLGDLVWSSDQTSIDSRSKLMVELRDDILNEATRLYYERRRLQGELLAQANASDASGLFDKQLRLDELTALLDALTGGEFSEAADRAKTK